MVEKTSRHLDNRKYIRHSALKKSTQLIQNNKISHRLLQIRTYQSLFNFLLRLNYDFPAQKKRQSTIPRKPNTKHWNATSRVFCHFRFCFWVGWLSK